LYLYSAALLSFCGTNVFFRCFPLIVDIISIFDTIKLGINNYNGIPNYLFYLP
jgi:hypothetical protein